MLEWADALWTCATARWSPRIGDPTTVGWATVAAYGLAAALCAWSAARARAAPRAERAFWIAAAALLAALAVNKQLDLQSLLTALGRCEARRAGWYEGRRSVQVAFIAAVVVTMAASSAVAAVALWRSMRRVWLALVGLTALAAFVGARAIGFHHVDRLIGLDVAGLRVNWIAELGSIGLVALGCAWAAAAYPPPAQRLRNVSRRTTSD